MTVPQLVLERKGISVSIGLMVAAIATLATLVILGITTQGVLQDVEAPTDYSLPAVEPPNAVIAYAHTVTGNDNDKYETSSHVYGPSLPAERLRHGAAVTTQLFDKDGDGNRDDQFFAWASKGTGGTVTYKYVHYDGRERAFTPREFRTCNADNLDRLAMDSVKVDTTRNGRYDTIYVAISCAGIPLSYDIYSFNLTNTNLVSNYETTLSSGGRISAAAAQPSISLVAYDQETVGKTPNAIFAAYAADVENNDGEYRFETFLCGGGSCSLGGSSGIIDNTDVFLESGAAIDAAKVDIPHNGEPKTGAENAVVVAYADNMDGDCGAAPLGDGDYYTYRVYDLESPVTAIHSDRFRLADVREKYDIQNGYRCLEEFEPAITLSPYRSQEHNGAPDHVFAAFTSFDEVSGWGWDGWTTWTPINDPDEESIYWYTGFNPAETPHNPSNGWASSPCDFGSSGSADGGAFIDSLYTPAESGEQQDRIDFFYTCDSNGQAEDTYLTNSFFPGGHPSEEEDDRVLGAQERNLSTDAQTYFGGWVDTAVNAPTDPGQAGTCTGNGGVCATPVDGSMTGTGYRCTSSSSEIGTFNCQGGEVCCTDVTVSRGERIVFATSETYTGDLGGVDGAREKCQGLGGAIDPDSDWEPLLSTESRTAADRIRPVCERFRLVNTNGDVVASSCTDLWDGSIQNPVQYSETGDPITSNTFVWSGTAEDGEINPIADSSQVTCFNWADGSASYDGTRGDITATDSDWIQYPGKAACSAPFRLYCFQQGTGEE